MDNIELQPHLLHVDDNEYLKPMISEQQKKIKSLQYANPHLSTVIITIEKRMIPKEYNEYYSLMFYFDSPSVLKIIRSSKDFWIRDFERNRNSPD
jgi:hypothetical protein